VLLELIQVITLIADLLLQVVEPNRRESLAQCPLRRGLDEAEKPRDLLLQFLLANVHGLLGSLTLGEGITTR